MTLHPDTAKTVLRKDPKDYFTYHGFLPWLGQGLLVSNGSYWARNRRLLTPAFHYEILKSYFPIYTDTARLVVKRWTLVPEGQSFNLREQMSGEWDTQPLHLCYLRPDQPIHKMSTFLSSLLRLDLCPHP
ncbi:hypothetical protein EMCRGX_G026002 [Ephydatia muelleri]